MQKKLNEILDKTKLKLLNVKQLKERVQKILDADEPDETALEQLSSEVSRRLIKTTKPETKEILVDITSIITQYRLKKSSKKDVNPGSLSNKNNLRIMDDDFHFGGGGLCMCSVPDQTQ
jgi:hypothetical protein